MFVCLWWYDDFFFGVVVYRSDFRRAVTWRTLVRCWLMWSGSDLAGHVCGRILWVLDRKSPIEVRLVCKPCSNMFPALVKCGDVCESTRLTVLPCPCSGLRSLRPKKSSQRLGGLKSLRTASNLSWSDCFNLCKMALPHWTCYNVALCSHRTFFPVRNFRVL